MGHVTHADHFPALHEERIASSDIAGVVVMSLAAVATAWCAYQSSVWGGLQARHYAAASKLRQEAVQQHLEGNQMLALDSSLFTSYVAARADNKDALANYMQQRFRPEMKVAMDAWLAKQPLEHVDAPKTPFLMPEYQNKAWVAGREAEALANNEMVEGVHSNHHSETYVLATVLFAVVLFFAGVGPKLPRPAARRLAFWFSAGLLVLTLLWMVTLPIAWS
ncbi:hypothetical protein AKJ09_06148 [Labilithrix luteola]|uniref:DUF4337 domain-containing protein n=1 Tax=Labilithrix luteola TaxID=1391654 RepID=A0A0K1Q274_9BACT|nr:hypothetical protein [Labilithrix luteola]AKU99484.1 hypothetical protein AKJ09_06148 [Labilithrix luteola]